MRFRKTPSLALGGLMLNFLWSAPLMSPIMGKALPGVHQGERVFYLHLSEKEFAAFKSELPPGSLWLAQSEPTPAPAGSPKDLFPETSPVSRPGGDSASPCDNLPWNVPCTDFAVDSLAAQSQNADSSLADTCLAIDSAQAAPCPTREEIKVWSDTPYDTAFPSESPPDRNALHFLQFTSDVMESKESWSELAVVIFVVVGVVVVAAFLVAGLVSAYDILVRKKDFPVWREINLIWHFSENRTNRELNDHPRKIRHMGSVQYTWGLERARYGLGLSAETGFLKVTRPTVKNPLKFLDSQGLYGLFGPVFRLRGDTPFKLDFEFLNGYSTIDVVGWIGKSNIVGKWDLSKHLTAGLNIGALMVNLKQWEGTLVQGSEFNSEFSLLMGFHLGFRY